MNEIHALNAYEFENTHPLARTLRVIGEHICKQRFIDLFDVSYEKVTFENDSWVNMNFLVDSIDPQELSQLNIQLSKELAKNKDFLNSEIEYIPSFTHGEIKCQSRSLNL
ncbi:hypothetical protein [Legionella bozemanae]|uniref:hypothetical protein n=1 Tax=Legionella bozemanae TaxID=447 RepID=UPI001041241A|nr:hypothetical protein [Legionella bozemanae]